MRTLYKNARLLDPASGLDEVGGLLIEDGKVLEIGPRVFVDAIQDDITVVDCAGKCLAPGLVDIRVESGEPGDGSSENLTSASRAAAAGGVTTMVCLPNTSPAVDDVAVLQFVERRGEEIGLVKVHSYAAATKGLEGKEMTEIGLLSGAGAVGFSDAGKAIKNAMVMRRLLSYAAMFGAVVIQHPEMPDLVGDGMMNEGETATRIGLPGIPAAAEVMMIERDLRLVELTGGRYHASRVTTAAAIEAIRAAKARGLPVTCDTAPHYFGLNEGAVVDYRTFAKVSPPLRSEDDRRAVLAALADGTIDAIASDHTPREPDSKRLPFPQASFGVVGLETMLAITLGAVHDGHLTMLQAIGALTVNPARVLGLDAGTLAVGGPADFVVFDADAPGRIELANLHSKSKNSAFEGRAIQGQVLRTLRGGKPTYLHPSLESGDA